MVYLNFVCFGVKYFEKFQTHEQQDVDFRMCWSSHSAWFGPEIKWETLCRPLFSRTYTVLNG